MCGQVFFIQTPWCGGTKLKDYESGMTSNGSDTRVCRDSSYHNFHQYIFNHTVHSKVTVQFHPGIYVTMSTVLSCKSL